MWHSQAEALCDLTSQLQLALINEPHYVSVTLSQAEALCDRVGIMTFGLMRTVGTPTELRLRFDQVNYGL